MINISQKSKSRRPKFLLRFSINQLTNIPQSAGYCYCKWHLKDGTGTSTSKIEQEGQQIDTNHQSKGVTERIFVKNHRAVWNYKVDPPIKVKLHVDKYKSLSKKILIVEVYFEFLEDVTKNEQSNGKLNHHSHTYTQKVTGKILLGNVTIDVTHFIDQNGTEFHDRFLLQKSKVNSILSMSIKMQLIRGKFEDFRLTNGEQLLQKNKLDLSNHMENYSDTSSNPMTPISSLHPPESSDSRLSGGVRKTSHLSHPKTIHMHGETLASLTISNQLVEKLYQKTFKFPWDPRPGEYTPQECVEDILEGGNGWAKNEKGINLIDLEALQITDLGNDDYLLASLLDQQGIHYTPNNSNLNWDILASKWGKSGYTKSRGEYLKANIQNHYYTGKKQNIDDLAAEKLKDSKSWKVSYNPSKDASLNNSKLQLLHSQHHNFHFDHFFEHEGESHSSNAHSLENIIGHRKSESQ